MKDRLYQLGFEIAFGWHRWLARLRALLGRPPAPPPAPPTPDDKEAHP